ncbi:CDP-alcohol phosphatidyltransferase family protein [Niabella insulamsoli]|uniref:CDP-alcohol phosphatidyltransferase family protein n=1 Tax=Niabella insulamsoli TaxID=3144874 RepID=UPI0031FC9201
MKQIPNLFTLLNLVFGCIAIIYIFKDDGFLFSNDASAFSMGLMIGGVYIFLAAIVDFLDGFVARLFNAASEMGAQLDSLADAVTFGVAPGMIMYRLLQLALSEAGMPADNIWYLLPAILLPCCAVWRLAKFNLDKEQHFYFKGVPTPAAGLTIASLPFVLNQHAGLVEQWLHNPYILYGIIGVISFLMVSNLPLISFKFKNFSVKSNADKFILLVFAILSIIFFKWLAVPVIFVAYVLVSLIFKPNKV